MRGSGGFRKLRWSSGGHGKSERDDLTKGQLRQLRKVIEKGYT
jgi:hypothetical protein